MKKCLLILCIILSFSLPVAAETTDDEVNFTKAVESLDREIQKEFDGVSLKDMYQDWQDGKGFSMDNASSWFWGFLSKEIKACFRLLMQLIFLGVLAAVFRSLGGEDGSIATMGHWVILISFTLVAVSCFKEVFVLGTDAIAAATDFLYGLLPLLLGFLATMGSVSALTVVQPTLLFMITLFLGITQRFFLPLVVVFAALVILGSLSPRCNFSQLQKLIKDIILFGLGIILTVFTGLLGLESLGAGAFDGLALKTVKMGIGNFIPLVGRHVSDALDAMIGASLLMKNTVGIFGIIGIVVVLALPALKILIMSFLFRGAGALLQPLGASEFSEVLQNFATVLTVLFALVTATAILFFFFIFILVGLSNLTMMFR